jgi:hypothetical protein
MNTRDQDSNSDVAEECGPVRHWHDEGKPTCRCGKLFSLSPQQAPGIAFGTNTTPPQAPQDRSSAQEPLKELIREWREAERVNRVAQGDVYDAELKASVSMRAAVYRKCADKLEAVVSALDNGCRVPHCPTCREEQSPHPPTSKET